MIFLDNNKQLNLGEKGYVIETLLSEEQVADLLHYFENIKAEHSYPFTLCSTSQELKKNVFELLRDKLQPALNSLLQNFRVTGANFYFKAHGSQVNTVPPHQDWTFVDETKFSSLNIWIPLIDVDKTNGAYHVIEGSHRWPFTYRGSNIPSAAANMPCNFDDMKYLPLRKGQGIIYDHRLLHCTPPNVSSTDRISLVLNVVPQEAELIHAILPEPGQPHLKIYAVDESFYWKYTFVFGKNEMPVGYKLIKEEKLSLPDFSAQSI